MGDIRPDKTEWFCISTLNVPTSSWTTVYLKSSFTECEGSVEEKNMVVDGVEHDFTSTIRPNQKEYDPICLGFLMRRHTVLQEFRILVKTTYSFKLE